MFICLLYMLICELLHILHTDNYKTYVTSKCKPTHTRARTHTLDDVIDKMTKFYFCTVLSELVLKLFKRICTYGVTVMQVI